MAENAKIDKELERAGCLNVKMAKSVLDDEFGGDISKLMESCPYLFSAEKRRKRARRIAGLE